MNEHSHVRAAFRFLQLADFFTIEQDALAKSEMLWCAAAHIVKAVAVQNGWDNRSHDQLFDAASGINDDLSIPGVYSNFYAAQRLHQNMYAGFMQDSEIAAAEIRVRQLVNRVAGAVTGP